MYLDSLVPGYQVYKRRRGATRISLDSSESYQLPTKTHSRATSLPTKYQASRLLEALVCEAWPSASRARSASLDRDDA